MAVVGFCWPTFRERSDLLCHESRERKMFKNTHCMPHSTALHMSCTFYSKTFSCIVERICVRTLKQRPSLGSRFRLKRASFCCLPSSALLVLFALVTHAGQVKFLVAARFCLASGRLLPWPGRRCWPRRCMPDIVVMSARPRSRLDSSTDAAGPAFCSVRYLQKHAQMGVSALGIVLLSTARCSTVQRHVLP